MWRWLVATGRSQWLTLAYAWNPLVVLEVAHSGHIDALGALWIAAAAFWLSRRRTALATIAFVLAVTTKLLPIVLVPLFGGGSRMRDALSGAALLRAAVPAVRLRRGRALRRVQNVVSTSASMARSSGCSLALTSPDGAARSRWPSGSAC